jgi:hypothetical protein
MVKLMGTFSLILIAKAPRNAKIFRTNLEEDESRPYVIRFTERQSTNTGESQLGPNLKKL